MAKLFDTGWLDASELFCEDGFAEYWDVPADARRMLVVYDRPGTCRYQFELTWRDSRQGFVATDEWGKLIEFSYTADTLLEVHFGQLERSRVVYVECWNECLEDE